MALNLYRRHRKDCEAGRTEDSTSGEFAERARGWKRCACVIFVSGTIAGRFSRKRTGATTWDDARAYAAAIEALGNWSGEPVPAVLPPEAPAAQARVTIEDGTSIFLTNRENAHIAAATLRKYRTFTKQLTAYADGRGYVMIDQFTPADADQFYTGLKLGPRTKGPRLGVLRAFFRFAVNRKWMSETPKTINLWTYDWRQTGALRSEQYSERANHIQAGRVCNASRGKVIENDSVWTSFERQRDRLTLAVRQRAAQDGLWQGTFQRSNLQPGGRERNRAPDLMSDRRRNHDGLEERGK